MRREVLRLGASVLRAPAAEVAAITPEITALVQDMIATMYAANGIGLAAPQVGVGLRLFVIDASAGRDPQALQVCINPTWDVRDGMQLEEEGCLSLPGFTATVVRPERAADHGPGSGRSAPPRRGHGPASPACSSTRWIISTAVSSSIVSAASAAR